MSERDPRDPQLDEALSALLDGELDAEAEAALRARLEGSPEAAARLRELEGIDSALRGIPELEVPSDLLARVHAAAASESPARTSARGRAPRGGRRWLAVGGALAAAAAAALALYLAPGAAPPDDARPQAPVARAPEAPLLPAPAPRAPQQRAPEPPPTRLAERPRPERAPQIVEAPQEAVADLNLGEASDEELLLAMELETLEDLELIEHLDLLERLDELQGAERG
jgi:negative regulator of sigma E activity